VKRFSAKLLLAFGGLIAGLLVAEVALRVVGYSSPYFYVIDQDRGIALRPGVEGWYRREGKQRIEINSDGLHDRAKAL
jgi:hypothetical protein